MPAPTIPADPVLLRFRTALGDLYGERLERVSCTAPGHAATRGTILTTTSPCSCTA